jgi:uncharacterized membrane protein
MIYATPIIAELGVYLIAAMAFVGLLKRYGRGVALMFLLGSLAWTTPLETAGILTGSYSYLGFYGSITPHFRGYFVWIGVVPLWVEMGWFIVSASSFMIFHDVLTSKRRALISATLAGLFAVNMDLLVDPVASANRLWIWIGPASSFLGIPLYNFFGWFIMIFLYDLIIWHTAINFRSMRGLSAVEKYLFSFKENLTSVTYSLRVKGFAFRLIILDIVAILLIKVASVIL